MIQPQALGGARYTPAPYSRTNAWTICWSAMPTDCICAMRSLAGLEKWHSSIEQVATESLHPHWQAMRAPTRRTSTLGFSEAVCAMAAAAMTSARMLFFNRRMFLRVAHDLRAGVLHFDFARDQADQGAADEDEAADPDPGDERENVSLNHGALLVVGHAAEIQVKVFVGALADADLGRALPARGVEALLRLERAEHFAALRDLDDGAVPLVILVLVLQQVEHLEAVGPDRHDVALVDFLHLVDVE